MTRSDDLKIIRSHLFDESESLEYDSDLVELDEGGTFEGVQLKDLNGGTYSTADPIVRNLMFTHLPTWDVGFGRFIPKSVSDFIEQEFSAPEGTGIRYQLAIEYIGVLTPYYWDSSSSSWEQSNGSYAQSSPQADIVVNGPTFDLSNTDRLELRVVLHSDDGTARPKIGLVDVEFDFEFEHYVGTTFCDVFVGLEDLGDLGFDPSDTTVTLRVENPIGFTSGSGTIIPPFCYEDDFVLEGDYWYAHVRVPESATAGAKYKFSATYTRNQQLHVIKFLPAIVPNISQQTLLQITSVDKRQI